MMIPVSLSPEMNSPVIQDDITSCTASDSDSSESDDEKTAATKVCKDTDVPVAKKAKSDAVKPVGRTRAAATSRMKGNAKAKTRPPAPASAGVKAQKIQKGSKSQRETQRAVASHCTDQAVQAVSQCQPPTDGTSDEYGRKKPKTDTTLQEKHNHPMQTHSQDQQKILPEPVSDPVSFQPPLHNSDEVHVLSDEGNRQAPLPSRWDVRTRRVSSRESACSGTPAPGTPRFGEPAPVSPQLVTPQSHQIHSQCPAVSLPQAGPESDSQQLTRRWDFTQGEVCSREFACFCVPVPGTPEVNKWSLEERRTRSVRIAQANPYGKRRKRKNQKHDIRDSGMTLRRILELGTPVRGVLRTPLGFVWRFTWSHLANIAGAWGSAAHSPTLECVQSFARAVHAPKFQFVPRSDMLHTCADAKACSRSPIFGCGASVSHI